MLPFDCLLKPVDIGWTDYGTIEAIERKVQATKTPEQGWTAATEYAAT